MRYIYDTIKKGVVPKEITLLLTKCFGEEYMSPKRDCFHCQVSNRCRYVKGKDLKETLRRKHQKEIDAKLHQEFIKPLELKRKKTLSEQKYKLKELNLSEKRLNKKLLSTGPFKIPKKELKAELREVQQSKKILQTLFQ